MSFSKWFFSLKICFCVHINYKEENKRGIIVKRIFFCLENHIIRKKKEFAIEMLPPFRMFSCPWLSLPSRSTSRFKLSFISGSPETFDSNVYASQWDNLKRKFLDYVIYVHLHCTLYSRSFKHIYINLSLFNIYIYM